MKKLAVVLFVSFMAVSAGAANWVLASEDPGKGKYAYVDIDSVSKQGNYKQSFVKLIDIPKGSYAIGLTSYDCKSNPRRMKPTHITMFDLEGNYISSNIEDSPFEPVLPDSHAERLVSIICN